MIPRVAVASAHRIGQSKLGANFLEQTGWQILRRESRSSPPARERRIAAVCSHAHNLHVRLVHIFLVDEIDARLGSGKIIASRRCNLHRRQPLEAARSLASIAAGSKSPLTETISFPPIVLSCHAFKSSTVTAPIVASSGCRV